MRHDLLHRLVLPPRPLLRAELYLWKHWVRLRTRTQRRLRPRRPSHPADGRVLLRIGVYHQRLSEAVAKGMVVAAIVKKAAI